MNLDHLLQEAATLLTTTTRPCILTGAGISRESGIPTYRDADGLWNSSELRKLASVAGFYEQPKQVWGFFEAFRSKVRNAQPNPAHQTLVQFEKFYFSNLPIITQNVDDLHERAGSANVIHLHGNLSQNRCSRYCRGVPSIVEDNLVDFSNTPPACPYCGAYIRPNVIFFGEFLHSLPMRRAEHAINHSDLMLIVGTSGVVAPASEMPQMAKANGARLIEINPKESELTALVDLWIPAPAGEALSRLLQIFEAKITQSDSGR